MTKFILGLSNAIRLIDLNKEQNSGMSIKGGRVQWTRNHPGSQIFTNKFLIDC